MPETSGQALEVRAADGGRVVGKQEQLHPWVCCGCRFCWVLVWQFQGFIGFQAPAIPDGKGLSPGIVANVYQLQVPGKGLDSSSVLSVWASLRGQLGAGLRFLLKL